MFHESYGEVEKKTLRLIRKHNVSPADYDELVGVFGTDQKTLRDAIEEYSPKGFYSSYHMMSDIVG